MDIKTHHLGQCFFYWIPFFLLFSGISYSETIINDEVVPYEIVIDSIDNAIPNDTIWIDVIKTAGSESSHAFDFFIGFDSNLIKLSTVTAGELFLIPGDYEWEYFSYLKGPLPICDIVDCPSGQVSVVSFADTDNGTHHPVEDPETGKILPIPDNTVLFTLVFVVGSQLDPQQESIPVYFYWSQCDDNIVAFSYVDDGPFDIRAAFSRYVYDFPGGNDITDYSAEIPTECGVPSSCLGETAERLTDYLNGGFTWGCADVNSDGAVNILDIIFLLNYRYKSGPVPETYQHCDVNGDYFVNILDIVYLINYMYKEGPRPECLSY